MKSASLDQTARQRTPRTFRDRYRAIRRLSEELIANLSPEDCTVQSMPDASPAKWHLAHTTWFFETFLLKRYYPDYGDFHPRFSFLFNSYYNAVGDRHPRPNRGLLTRPSLSEVLEYRAAVDDAMEALWDSSSREELRPIVEIGLHHEQQHQELLLTDIKHLFAQNPLWPALVSRRNELTSEEPPPLEWIEGPSGLLEIGEPTGGEHFCYDNETPRHRVYLEPFQLGSRLVTNGEYLEFIDNGGYRRPELWLSDGWDVLKSEGWVSPLYWEPTNDGWRQFTLGGEKLLEEREPVCHLSYYEADAYARWAGARLPTEAEWEVVARTVPRDGHFADSRRFHPAACQPGGLSEETADRSIAAFDEIHQMFGDVWEWTQSPYVAYPGYSPPPGALGEYNGKFMCNQMVLRGGSCATSQSHIRASYRNFFKPEARWQFSGLRLARDVG